MRLWRFMSGIEEIVVSLESWVFSQKIKSKSVILSVGEDFVKAQITQCV